MSERTFFGHPRGLYYLFFAELWERFSFYGMRALLTLYMVQQVFSKLVERDVVSAVIFASYGSLVYVTPIFGGQLSDRLLGFRRSLLLGGVLMSIGHFIMAIDNDTTFFLALGFLVIGNGLFKPNVSSFVGALYENGDLRKDSGYTIYYMGINIGGSLAPLLCGYVGVRYGWHYGFAIAGVGMVVGLLCFVQGLRAKVFGEKGLPPDPRRLKKVVWGLSLYTWVIVLCLVVSPIVGWMISAYGYLAAGQSFLGEVTVVELFFKLLGIFLIIYIARILIRISGEERKRFVAALFLTLCMTMFWGVFELQGSTLVLFALRNVDLIGLNASQTPSINATFIILLSIPMSMLWSYLSRRGMNPRSPYKFVFGLFLASLGFYALFFSKIWANPETGSVPLLFLMVFYFFLSVGELFMSPVGLSKMTELAPKHMLSFTMGVWLLSSAYAFQIVGFIGKKLAIQHNHGEPVTEPESLIVYTDGFLQIGHFTLAIAFLALVFSPLITRYMKGVH